MYSCGKCRVILPKKHDFFCDVLVGLKDGLLELSALSCSYWRRTAVCELGGVGSQDDSQEWDIHYVLEHNGYIII